MCFGILDDILIYSSTLDTHIQHLEQVFVLMQQHTLFAKRSKCSFAMDKVEYLGHFISGKGVDRSSKGGSNGEMAHSKEC